MYFMRLWYSFLDKFYDRKFKAIFITSCVSLGILLAVIIGLVFVLGNNKDNSDDKDVISPVFTEDTEKTVLINGVDITGMSNDEIVEVFNELAQNYSLKVLVDGKEIGTVNGNEIDLKYNSECNLEEYLETDSKKRSADSTLEDTTKSADEALEHNIQVNNIFSYDEEKLNTAVDNIIASLGVTELTSDLVNIEYSAETGYSLSVLADSKFIDTKEVINPIKLALEEGALSVELDSAKMYFADNNALIEGDERIKKAEDTLNLYIGSVLNYDFKGEFMVIDAKKINSWFYLDSEFNVSVDENAVQIYTNRLAEDFTDYSGTLKFKTSYGSDVFFRTAASEQVDTDTLFSYLVEDVKKGTTVNRTVPYIDTNIAGSDGNFGGTYVEINLTKQHLFFYYQGNLIVDCDIVSGCVDKEYVTPRGIYKVRYKKKDAILNGVEYTTPVDYWMPFNGGIGMHDADWRVDFGGSIYLYDGSHGCINMPEDAVAKVFEYAYPGMTVVVYGGAYTLDDEAALEALNQSSTKPSTEKTTEEKTTKAEKTTAAVVLPEETTVEVEVISTETQTEAATEAPTETEVSTEAITEPFTEALPPETESSGEAVTEAPNV